MADVSLNGLKVKTDSLPNDWYVSLINPKDGEPAEIMTVAKLVELLPFLLKLGGVMDSALQVRVGLSGDALIEDTIGLIHFGSMPSSGLPYMSYGLKYKTNENKIISTWDASRIAYFMYIFNSDGLYFGIVDEGIKPVGTEVSISFHKITNSVSLYSLSKNDLTDTVPLQYWRADKSDQLVCKIIYIKFIFRFVWTGRVRWFNSS